MKPKTKKILIIVAAVLIVAVILYFAFRKNKNNPGSIISGLSTDQGTKALLSSMVSYINSSWDDEHKQMIAQNAETKGRTLAQQTVAEAAYALWDSGQIDAATYSSIVAQL